MFAVRWARLLVAVVVLALLVAAGGVAWWQRSRPAPDRAVASPAFCQSATLRVIAAPEIADVVRAAARPLNPTGAACGPVQVIAQEPAVTAAAGTPPDVWIPSSTAWTRIAAVNGARYTVRGAPVARSPVVIAAPRSIAKLFADGDRTSWAKIVRGAAAHRIPAVAMPDPLQDTVGMLSVLGVQAAMARTTPDAGIAQLRALTLRSRLTNATAGPAALLAADAALTDETAAVYDVGVFPVTEQQWRGYQRRSPAVPLVAAHPVDAPVEADYPVAVSSTGADAGLTDRFVHLLRTPATRRALTDAGFRTRPRGKPMALPADADAVIGPAVQWSQYRSLSFQVLLLVDASGSMNERIRDRAGRTTTKAALLRESGVAAASLFSEGTSIGMWYFGTPEPSSPAHTEVVPFGPITAATGGRPRREVLAATIKGYRAPAVSGTPLYRTVLDGVAAMQRRARPGVVTLVVVLTDGDDEESRYAMSRDAFLDRLGGGSVPVFGVGYGAGADMDTLRRMSEATGGKAFAAANPSDLASAMARTFLAAHAPG